jgi:hypothetical protein
MRIEVVHEKVHDVVERIEAVHDNVLAVVVRIGVVLDEVHEVVERAIRGVWRPVLRRSVGTV